MNDTGFSLSRWIGILVKEFIQLKRDRLTFGMIIGIPVLQLILFGYAINTDPKNLPTAVLDADSGSFARSFIAALENTGYFRIVSRPASETEADDMLARGDVQFVVTIPADFTRQLMRGQAPELLVEADATDPTAVSNAVNAVQRIALTAINRDLAGPLARAVPSPPPIDVRVHRRYNPEGVTAYNIVPGVLGTIMTMTMVLMTGLAMTRERERGTFENLLSTPALPIEVMTGKIVPYIMIGLIQVTLILLAACYLFHVPMVGNLAGALRDHAAVHRRQPDARHHVLVAGAQPAAGDADDVLLLPAVDPALRLHVPVPRHAGVGAGDRQRAAAHAFPGAGARAPAQGYTARRPLAACVADRRVHARGDRDRAAVLSPNPRLSGSHYCATGADGMRDM